MLSQSGYLFAAKVFGYGLRILLPVFLVRIMPKADIGAYSQFFLLEILIKNLFELGMNQSQYFFVPRDPKNAGGYLLNTILLNVTCFVVAYSLVGPFRVPLAGMLRMPVLDTYFTILAGFSFMMLISVILTTYMQARNLFIQSARYEFFLQILASLATLAAALATRDLGMVFLALMIARTFGTACGLAWVHFSLKGFQSDRYFSGFWQQIKYGAPLGVVGLLSTLLMQMHQFAVSRYFDIETYAVYAQGLKQVPILQFYTQAIASVALVRFARLEQCGDWGGIRRNWDKLLAGAFGIGIPLIVLFVIFARPLVVFMFTEDYIDAVPIFRVNAIAMLFFILNPTLVLRAMDRNDITVKVYAVLVLILPVALFFGMKTWGLMGIITIHAATLVLSRVICHMILNRIIPINLPYFPSGRNLMAFFVESTRKLAPRKGSGTT